jgi:hypothetical protein
MAAITLVIIGALVVGVVAINVYLRSWVRTESRIEAHMRDPRTHSVAYAVPNGVDPALIRFELSRAGFDAASTRVGDMECLRIECEHEEQERVRSTIQRVPMTGYDGCALKLDPVVFEDER